ncbi:MAG: NAD(P)-dependent oxidoreductase [Saprospiraceae bacterium]|nr:NAD(P)-dependent oxidoreductase [Saprospiraceae bacterium]
MKKKVLITGATGFIGGFIVRECLSRGYEVTATVRKSSDTSGLKGLDIKLIEWNFEDILQMTESLQYHQFEYIIHNAGLTKSPEPKAYWKVNTTYLDNLLCAIKNAKINIQKFVFISSLASYGPADFQKNGILDSNSVPHPVTNYGRSKLDSENLLINSKDIPWVILRPTAVYGPMEKDLFNVFETINKGIELVAGFGKQKLTFIYVKDLAKMIVDAMSSDVKHKGYFVTDGQSYEGKYFNSLIKKHLSKKTVSIRLPIFVIKGVAYVSEKVSALSGKYPSLNIEKVNEIKARSWNCDISEQQKDLGFTAAYTLDEGIKETILWYKENNWLK